MGRIGIVDKSVENILTSTSSAASAWSIGLLIGSAAEQRDYIIHYAQTPLEDEDRAKTLSTISDVLVTSHAGELQRMLPGGLCICGIAAVGPDLSSYQTKLQQIMLATYKKISQSDANVQQSETWQLIMMDSVTKKITSRSLLVSDYKSTFKPSDIRFQPLNGGWLIAETSLAVDQHYFIKRQQQDQHFEQQLLEGLQPLTRAVDRSVCFFNGQPLEEDCQLGMTEASGKAKKAATQNQQPTLVNVQLLSRPPVSSDSTCDEMVSSLWLKGTVSAIAFLRAPALVGEIEEALKSDLKKSIVTRCQLLCEDILQVGSEKHSTEEQLIYETPPRVYIPHGTVPVVFNDYMFKDEKTEDCAERAQQLLGITQIDASTIDTSVERSAKLEDVEYLQTLRNPPSPESEQDTITPPRAVMGSLGRIASIASGAAIAIAVSLTYLNLDEWFG